MTNGHTPGGCGRNTQRHSQPQIAGSNPAPGPSAPRRAGRAISNLTRRCPTPTLPGNLSAAIDLVIVLFNKLFALVSGIIFPATATEVSVLAAFGILFPLVIVILSFFRTLVSNRA